MVDLTRRFFLGGAISLIAVATFTPSVSAMSNLPTIYGDGKGDDTHGLGALFRNEPVTFNKEMLGVNSHKGITFHKGMFRITRTINIPKDVAIKIERARFYGVDLELNEPFFMLERGFDDYQLCDNRGLIFEVKFSYNSELFVFPKEEPDTYSLRKIKKYDLYDY